MESKVNYALIGLFVIILSMALVASVLWLSIGTEPKTYHTYQAYIQESVSGLNRKAPVKYRGVEVGYVDDIALVPEKPDQVYLLLQIEQGVPLKQDTIAILSTQGLTGLAHIELTGGSREAATLTRQEGQVYPEIKTQPSLLMRLDTAISSLLTHLDKASEVTNRFLSDLDSDNLADNVANLSHSITTLLSEKNSLAITHTLHNIDVVSTTLANHVHSFDAGLSNLVQTTENINRISQQAVSALVQLESSLATIEQTSRTFTQTAELINDIADKSLEKVDNTTHTIAETAEEIKVVVQESRQDMNYFTRQALPEVTNSLQELHRLLTTLRGFTQELERKPNMLLFGKSKTTPGPGE